MFPLIIYVAWVKYHMSSKMLQQCVTPNVNPMLIGASMVKWTYPDLCLVWSESDRKIYTNFKLCEEETINIL